jgi:hypothetical protein
MRRGLTGVHDGRVRVEMVPGVYWSERNELRPCVIVLVDGRTVTALDAETRERILDPPSAIRTR